MKICYVANSRFPSERAHMTQIVAMCNAFTDLGHEVTLLVTDRKTHITLSPEEFFGVPINFEVIRISVPDIAGRAHKIPVVLRPFVFLLQRVVFAYRAARFIDKRAFDYTYGRDEWILWLLTRLTHVPIMWESHEAKFSKITRLLLKKIKNVVVISEGIRDFYIEKGIDPKNILVAHDAVDNRFLEQSVLQGDALHALHITRTKPIVMYIGGLESWKGVGTLLEASRNQDLFETYIIGGKEGEISQLKMQYPFVHFLGPRPYRELPLCQQAADVLVIPNTAKIKLSAEYTSPLKLFTYMTSRKPIVASNIPSISNVLTSEEAFFFTADNPSSLRAEISNVLADAINAQKKANLAYKKGAAHTWSNRAKTIIKFLD